jgi:nucleoid DNA-binding protein
MYHHDVVAAVARRLPHRTQKDVAEVIDLMFEIWQDELVQGNDITIPGIGRLVIDVQNVKVSNVVRQWLGPNAPSTIPRHYGRLRLFKSFKALRRYDR